MQGCLFRDPLIAVCQISMSGMAVSIFRSAISHTLAQGRSSAKDTLNAACTRVPSEGQRSLDSQVQGRPFSHRCDQIFLACPFSSQLGLRCKLIDHPGLATAVPTRHLRPHGATACLSRDRHRPCAFLRNALLAAPAAKVLQDWQIASQLDLVVARQAQEHM